MITKKIDKSMIFLFITNLWKESCALFAWKNLKLFLLASLNTFVRSLFLVLRYFWWLLLAIFALRLSNITIARDLLILLLTFSYLLIVRSSIEVKDYDYYLRYMRKFPSYLFIALAVIGLVFIPFKVLASVLNFPFNYPGSIECGPFSFVFIAGLFLLDRRNSLIDVFASIYSAMRFVLYYLPVMALFFVCEYFAVYYTIDAPFVYFSMQLDFPLKFMALRTGLFIVRHILTLLLFSFLATLYVRVKHKHHKLFFTP